MYAPQGESILGAPIHSFEEAYRRTELELQHRTESALVVRKVQLEMPRFFTDLRVELLRRVFARIDVDGGGTLDLNEVTPLIKYISHRHLSVSMTTQDVHDFVDIFDSDGSSDIDFGELLNIIKFLILAKSNSASFRAPFQQQQQQQQQQQPKDQQQEEEAGDAQAYLAAAQPKEQAATQAGAQNVWGGSVEGRRRSSQPTQPGDSSAGAIAPPSELAARLGVGLGAGSNGKAAAKPAEGECTKPCDLAAVAGAASERGPRRRPLLRRSGSSFMVVAPEMHSASAARKQRSVGRAMEKAANLDGAWFDKSEAAGDDVDDDENDEGGDRLSSGRSSFSISLPIDWAASGSPHALRDDSSSEGDAGGGAVGGEAEQAAAGACSWPLPAIITRPEASPEQVGDPAIPQRPTERPGRAQRRREWRGGLMGVSNARVGPEKSSENAVRWEPRDLAPFLEVHEDLEPTLEPPLEQNPERDLEQGAALLPAAAPHRRLASLSEWLFNPASTLVPPAETAAETPGKAEAEKAEASKPGETSPSSLNSSLAAQLHLDDWLPGDDEDSGGVLRYEGVATTVKSSEQFGDDNISGRDHGGGVHGSGGFRTAEAKQGEAGRLSLQRRLEEQARELEAKAELLAEKERAIAALRARVTALEEQQQQQQQPKQAAPLPLTRGRLLVPIRPAAAAPRVEATSAEAMVEPEEGSAAAGPSKLDGKVDEVETLHLDQSVSKGFRNLLETSSDETFETSARSQVDEGVDL